MLDDGYYCVLLYDDSDKVSLDDSSEREYLLTRAVTVSLDDGRNRLPLDDGGNVVCALMFGNKDHSTRMTDNLPID